MLSIGNIFIVALIGALSGAIMSVLEHSGMIDKIENFIRRKIGNKHGKKSSDRRNKDGT